MPQDKSILDEYFGPKRIQNEESDVVRTNWPKAPEHIRPLLDTWQEITGLNFRRDRKYQIKCAHSWYNEFGGDPQLVRDAFRKHKEVGYNYKSLDSIRYAARTIRGKKIDTDSREERDKYLKWNE